VEFGLGGANFGYDAFVLAEFCYNRVYTLAAFFTSLIILQSITLSQNPSASNLIKLSFCFGLSLTHHLSSILLGPWLLLLILWTLRNQRIKLQFWFISIIVALLPLGIYLYLPIRFLSNTSINYVINYFDANLASLKGLYWMISGKMFGPEMFGRPLLED